MVTNEFSLTKREIECLFFVSIEAKNDEIALSMMISPRTVESYIKSLKIKLSCKSKKEVIRFCKINTKISMLLKNIQLRRCDMIKSQWVDNFTQQTQLAKNILGLCYKNKISISELARNIDFSQSVLRSLSTGENNNPRLDTLIPIARYFKVSLSQLVGEVEL